MKFFCKAGPVRQEDHYYIPSLSRIKTENIPQLIDQKKYFILHAPRQTGKTSFLLELVKTLNAEGIYTALYVNVEGGQAARGDFINGMAIILEQFFTRIKEQLPKETHIITYLELLLQRGVFTGASLNSMLSEWARHSIKPLVIFIDEIDSLVGDTLISVLRQLRSGYDQRPQAFPQSLCLIGVRDVRDYLIWSDTEKKMVLGGSAFNIKDESLRLPDFTKDEVYQLYQQHTQATGQKFDVDAIDYVFELTQGQPWLVNALAYQACFKDVTDRSQPITKDTIERSKETLIARRDTHIDSLLDRLHEDRVRCVIDAIVSGGEAHNFTNNDVSYVTDLGLIKKESFEIANPIYKEIIPRELTAIKQRGLTFDKTWYIKPDGLLDMPKFLEAFAQFFREGSTDWLSNFDYQESGPHLLVMAYLQRVINGGGSIHREYALGRKRVDLLIKWPALQPKQRIVIEIKILKDSTTLPKGLQQTAKYMDINNATEGHLIIFDRNSNASWDEKIYHKQESLNGKNINVWGM